MSDQEEREVRGNPAVPQGADFSSRRWQVPSVPGICTWPAELPKADRSPP